MTTLSFRDHRNKLVKKLCPTCGKEKQYTLIYGAYNSHGRIRVRSNNILYVRRPGYKYRYPTKFQSPNVRIRLNKKIAKLKRRDADYPHGLMGRTYVVCTDPFHDYIHPDDLPKPNPPIPPRVHNPDLTKNKRIMKRDLQGKHRR